MKRKIRIPKFYIWFAIVAALMLLTNTLALIVGIVSQNFTVNPIYVVMLIIGFTGLLITDLVAIHQYKKRFKE